MKSIGLLLDSAVPADSFPQVDRLISLAPLDATQSLHVVDGEQTYALYDLTKQADDLAMTWSRAVYAALIPTSWRPLLTYRGIDLKPLVINRLFRGYFLDQARNYLGIQRILEAEAPQSIAICSTSNVKACFARAACFDAGIEPTQCDLPVTTQRRVRIPSAFVTFVRGIAAPALRHAFSAPRPPLSNTDTPHIIFIQRGALSIRMVSNALETLQAERSVVITIIRFDPESSFPTYPRARSINWDSYQNPATLSRLLVYQTRVMTLLGAPKDWPHAVLSQVAPYTARFLRQIGLPSIVHTLELTRRIIKVERPNLLAVVDETGLLGKAVAVQGRQLNVPTLNIQHGVRTDSPWIEDQLFDRFAVFGPSTTEVFAKRGNDPAMFVPTGAPRYDRLFKHEGIKARHQVATELNLDPSRPIITFASQPVWGLTTPAVKRETYLALVHAWQQTDAQLVIKLHHSQADYVPPEAIKEPGWEHVKVTAEYDLYDLLNASDIIVTAYSTVGMEAVALDKPLLIINLTGQPDPIPYVQEGVAIGAYQTHQVSQALRSLLSSNYPIPDWQHRREQFIRRHLTSDDGRSAERVAQLMLEMMQPRS